ncbi:malectin domain-containing carbohydrate-binding protein, partial [Halorubrum sp. CBA1125]|uniref:malectin domain-containing carbohydrate-binding protein n=1 Tax=Halorubrum sp. CBA1125 TaxID=2668072 RepID=UPI001E5F18A4
MPLEYGFPVADGTYEVRMYYQEQKTDVNAPEDRIFNVSVEDEVVLEEYSVVGDVGKDTGVMKDFTVEVNDGHLNISETWVDGDDYPIVYAIEVYEVTEEAQSAPEVIAGEDGTIDQSELGDGIFYYQTGNEVPNTGGQTIDQDMLGDLIFYYQTGNSVTPNSPPTAEITTPSDGDTFQDGDTITYAATGSDPDETLDDSNFEWDIGFVHNQHTHPHQTSVQGQSGSFVADIPSSHDAEDNLGYELILTVTDSEGATATDSVTVDYVPETSGFEDFDNDGVLNENDADDDGDGIPDVNDPFAVDPDNGLSTTAPVNLNLEANS